MKNIAAAALALLLIPFAFACTDDGVTKPATDRITVEPSSNSLTLLPGQSSTINITVIRPVGYTGPLTLTADNLPDGVSGSFSPSTLQPGETASALILTADENAPDGTGAVTVSASGTDVDPQSATISVTVGSAMAGSFSISVIPGLVTAGKGGSASALITIDRTGGFSQSVLLDVSGFPSGVFASVSPGATSGNSASIIITVSNSVLSGTYSATVTASADGAPPQSASLSLTVTTALKQ